MLALTLHPNPNMAAAQLAVHQLQISCEHALAHHMDVLQQQHLDQQRAMALQQQHLVAQHQHIAAQALVMVNQTAVQQQQILAQQQQMAQQRQQLELAEQHRALAERTATTGPRVDQELAIVQQRISALGLSP
jgi:hypothetical protein